MAVTVGHYVYTAEPGLLGSLAAAFLVGAATLILGQIAFATIRSTPVRFALGALYALPAGVAGFHAIKGLSGIGGAGETWTQVFAGIGAVVIGTTVCHNGRHRTSVPGAAHCRSYRRQPVVVQYQRDRMVGRERLELPTSSV